MPMWDGKWVTEAQFDRFQDESIEAYDRVEADVIAEWRDEWEGEFGNDPNMPFKYRPEKLHAAIMKRLKR